MNFFSFSKKFLSLDFFSRVSASITINKFKPVIYLERNFGPDRIPLDDFMFWIGYKQVPENEFIYINNFYERRRETES